MTGLGVSHRAGDAAVGLALAAGGIALAILAWPIPRGEIGNPGPGFMPFVLGLLLIGLGLVCAIRALREHDTTMVVLANRKSAVCLVALAAAALAFIPVGFVPTVAVFLTVLFGVLAEKPWWRAAIYGCGASVALFVVFEQLLGLGLPAGIWPF
ncbi:MAG: tripartite tricarboxylate transporter TctB family protein [Rhodoplanes sp.]|uniref:tripartite tricarboxylate transporter TctB family protein n=1 Tax=Rhodoplanes sp. TaxID=1968906 RepID=UPI0017D837D4|nr:tripartite tricarboxylate transporter TctB family protein [Rhodoplanes sp.]NVO16768.1 tripartite tricarboxylate transporter TctB family protein [Rhodoplanes sp.]